MSAQTRSLIRPFAAVLKRYRIAATLSQEALAERAGISVRGLSDLERGLSRAPRLDTLHRLAEALGLEGADRQALASAAGFPPVDGVEGRTATDLTAPRPPRPTLRCRAISPDCSVVKVRLTS